MRILSLSLLLACAASAQNTDAGRRQFENRCARCHGADATGGESGPGIVTQIAARSEAELAAFIRTGSPARGMPPIAITDAEMNDLAPYLRSLAPISRNAPPAIVRRKVQTTDGQTIEGQVLSEGVLDLELRTGDRQIRLLRKVGDRYRIVTSQTDWPSYNGDPSGNRYTKLTQINKENVSRMAAKWIFPMPNVSTVENTPVVIEGIMYVSSANECWGLDAGSGRTIWHFQRPRTKGLAGNAASGFNRGVAAAVDRIFMLTDNAHIIALNRYSGALVWETEMADWHQNYNGTSAPLAVGNMVVSGTATAAMKAYAALWLLTIRPPAKKSGASGLCRNPASQRRKHGTAILSTTPPAAPPG